LAPWKPCEDTCCFGIGTEVLAVIALFVMFRRRGWMGKKS
jgi:hypothetical protein